MRSIDWKTQRICVTGGAGFLGKFVCDAMALPALFHHGSADRIIVATARVLNCPWLAGDKAVLDCPQVHTIA